MSAEPNRREFVASAMRGAAVLAGAPFLTLDGIRPRRPRARWADGHIEILLAEPVGTIAPEIQGHFVEHLGGVVYDGIWVGEDSRVPNYGGVRKALVDALKAIRPAVVRWPGGCFADSYDWRDGVGDPASRPRRTNIWADDRNIRDLGNIPARFDPNTFGTNEFMRFARLVGAEPYMAANVRTLPARAFAEWVEYCNSPAGSTTLSDLRAAGGDPDPFNARYWGIGNESWGCGGNFTPDEYAMEYRRFSTWPVPDYGVGLRFVASGPSGNDRAWTRRFFEKLAERRETNRMWGWALHHYCSARNGEAVAFDEPAWYELLASANRMESLITGHWELMAETDRQHHVKLVVDEWGAWHSMTTNLEPGHLFGQQSTVRDALVAGLTLDIFNRHADKVAMANIAQLVNCIQSLFLADEDKFLVTPTYHVFAMHAPHQGAASLRTEFSAPDVAWTDGQGNAQSLQAVHGSGSLRDRSLVLTVTNRHIAEPMSMDIAIRGATVRAARATTLRSRDVHDHNTFERPDTVRPVTSESAVRGEAFAYEFPAASVTRLDLELA